MKPIKLILFCIIVTLVMIISWAVGNVIGNSITGSTPPPLADPSYAGIVFLLVCVFNSLLVVLLVITTGVPGGRAKSVALFLFVFTIQTALPQMDTFFFGHRIGIGYDQATAIVIAGAIMSFCTVMIAILVHKKFRVTSPSEKLSFTQVDKKKILPWMMLLCCIVYPLLYQTFGYYVAWQSETLRVYYTSSREMGSFAQGIADSLVTGLYFFQVLRALIWILATIPIIAMLAGRPSVQLIVVGLLTSLLPSSLLFIPNPYMPSDVALVHFIETASSNLIWGLIMVMVIRRCYLER